MQIINSSRQQAGAIFVGTRVSWHKGQICWKNMQTNNRLPARGRLKHRKLIDALFSEGQKFSAGPYRVYFSVQPARQLQPTSKLRSTGQQLSAGVDEMPADSAQLPAGAVLFGTGVSKKKFARAVDRNLIKRHCREAYRQQQQPLQQFIRENNCQLMLFFIYTSHEHLPFDSCHAAVGQALEKIKAKLNRSVVEKSTLAKNALNKRGSKPADGSDT